MCGRFSFFDVEKIQDRFGTVNTLEITPSFNISPGASTAVITRHSPNKIELMKWGLIPYWAKDPKIGAKMFNARAETIFDKPSFRRAIKHQRCLVPVNGFYEWKKEEHDRGNKGEKGKMGNRGKNIPYLFRLKDEPIFALAGIYDIWNDPEGRPIYSFAIITTTANKVMAPIHDRMPVVLERKDEERWLAGLRQPACRQGRGYDRQGETEELGSLGHLGILGVLRPYEGKDLVVKPYVISNF